jgi:hypothetical protein
MQSLTQSVADDEIAAEFAASWAADDDFPGLAPALVPADGGPPRLSALRPLERQRAGDPRDLLEAAERVRPVSLAREQVLPVAPVLATLLPDGLPRGSSVAVSAAAAGRAMGSTALAFALAAAPSATGSWVATVGLPELGLAAAAEIGVALERVAVIGAPPPESWATVVASLVGAFDIVLLGPPPADHIGEARRLVTRARERGSVLIQLDHDPRSTTNGLDVDLRLTVIGAQWSGLGAGHGRLRGRRLEVEVSGRRRAARPRRADLWLLDPDGTARVCEADGERAMPAKGQDHEAFAGSDVEQLIAARRARLQRAARQPLPAPPVDPDAVEGPLSDAG